MQKFVDAATIAAPRKTADGYLVASVLCARTGCYDYLGSELGLKNDDVIKVYRPEDTVFAADSMKSFPGKPVTIEHPSEPVTADNWKGKAVGDIVAVVREGEYVRADIKIMDAEAIKAIEDGKRELSVGYSVGLELQDGVAPDGTEFQAIQTGTIKVNHLALVDRARAGSECRIADGAATWGAAPITPSRKEDEMSDALNTVVLGDKAVQVAAKDAPAIEAFKAEMTKQLADAESSHKTALAAKDKELAAKDAKIEDLEGKILSDEDIDKRVASRAKLMADAAKVDKDAKLDGLSDADVRKAIVAAKLGDEAVNDRSDAYIEARFDALVEAVADAKAKPFDKPLKHTGDGDAWGAKVMDAAGVKTKKEA